MNVWIQNPFDNLPSEGYRKQRYWLMAEAFVRAGHQVTLWTSDFNHVGKRYRGLGGLGGSEGLEVRLIPTRAYRKNVSWERVRSHRAYAHAWERSAEEVAAARGRPDLLIVSVPPLATGAVALRLARRFNARLIADVQDAWPETFVRLLPRPLRPLAPLLFAPLTRAARRLYRGADLVTGVCDRYRGLVLAAGARAYERFYLGILPATTPQLRMRQQSPSASPQLRLVYAGGLGASYDLETALRALVRAPFATLDVAGDGPHRADLEQRARALGVADRVTFHGRLPAAALEELLASSTAGLVPMTEESFVGIPNKVADYASAGLVAVSSLNGECADLLARHGAHIAYRAGEADSLAAALAMLKANPPAPDFAGLMGELDARRIYASYVRATTRS